MPREASGAGWIRSQFNIYVPLPAGTGAAEIVTDLKPGFRFYVEKCLAYVAIAGTGASASRTFRVLKGASTVVATATLVLADTATLGAEKVLAVTAANNEYGDADVLTVDFASGGTAFTAGALNLCIQYRTRPQQL
jgi:hypothetical protein